MNYSLTQRTGLTGKLLGSKMPFNIEDRYNLATRRNDIISKPTYDEPSGAVGAEDISVVEPTYNSSTPITTNTEGLKPIDVTKADMMAFAAGAAPPVAAGITTGGFGFIPALGLGLIQGTKTAIMGRAAKGIKNIVTEKIVDPVKNYFGFGGEEETANTGRISIPQYSPEKTGYDMVIPSSYFRDMGWFSGEEESADDSPGTGNPGNQGIGDFNGSDSMGTESGVGLA